MVSAGFALASQVVSAAHTPKAPGVNVAVLSREPVCAVVPFKVKVSFSLAFKSKLNGAEMGAAGQLPLLGRLLVQLHCALVTPAGRLSATLLPITSNKPLFSTVTS